MTKISIITLTLNSAETINDTINSIDQQSYKKIEHICVDSYSKDNTFAILKENRNIRRKIFRSRKKGIYKNLNYAMKLATGNIIIVLHSDDIFYDKNVIKKIVKEFESKQLDILYTDIEIVKKNDISFIIRNWISNSKIYHNKIMNGENYKDLMKNGWMPPHTGFFFKKKFKFMSYNTTYSIASDYDFMIKLINKSKKILYLPIKSTRMRIGGESSKLFKLFKKSKEDLEIIKKNKLGSYLTLFKKILRKSNQFF